MREISLYTTGRRELYRKRPETSMLNASRLGRWFAFSRLELMRLLLRYTITRIRIAQLRSMTFPENNLSLDAGPASQLKVGADLKKGSIFAGVKLSDASKAARFILQVSQNGEAKPCTAYLPAPPKEASSPIGKSLSQRIFEAQGFVIWIETLPNGHVGTIYPNRSLFGTYTSGRKEWENLGSAQR